MLVSSTKQIETSNDNNNPEVLRTLGAGNIGGNGSSCSIPSHFSICYFSLLKTRMSFVICNL